MNALKPGDPERVGSYRLVRRLGRGGMGQVFLGESPGGRPVAVKLIRPELGGDPEFRARFAREVEAARNVSGLFTAPVVDADPDAPEPWLVTAYVPGPSLAEAVQRDGPMATPAVLALVAGLAEGLMAIHAAGVVHRDLKPSNVLLAADGPRIIDFGISRAMDSTALTRTGLVVGSPGFMSPEQALGREAGPPSDIFCLGAVLVYAATAQGPFGAGTSNTVLYRIVYGPPAVGDLPPELRSLAARCLDKDPGRRPTAAQILAERGGARLSSDAWAAASRPPAAGVAPTGAGPRPAALLAPTGADPGPPVARDDGAGPQAPLPRSATPAAELPTTTALSPIGPGARAGASPPDHQRPPAPERQRPPRTDRQRPRGRRRSAWLIAALPAVAAVALAAALLLPKARQAGAPPARPAAPARPRAVVSAFIRGINQRNWALVWYLGGRNMDPSKTSMIAGFRGTARDTVRAMHARGDVVTVRFIALQTDGTAQVYEARYVVRNGVITQGTASPVPGG